MLLWFAVKSMLLVLAAACVARKNKCSVDCLFSCLIPLLTQAALAFAKYGIPYNFAGQFHAIGGTFQLGAKHGIQKVLGVHLPIVHSLLDLVLLWCRFHRGGETGQVWIFVRLFAVSCRSAASTCT